VALTLYAIPVSNPANAARGMIAHKRLDHRLVRLPIGFHPLLVRAAGFPGWTVPALETADGRRVQGTLAISRCLDELQPDPPLFGADPERRRAIETAERWGEATLQPVPRRIFRRAIVQQDALRRWLLGEVAGMPMPGFNATVGQAIPRRLATVVGATEEAARADVAGLPALLDQVDALIAEGVIGGDQPSAADFQVLASVAALGLMVDLQPALEGRPCQAATRRLFPRYDGIPTPPGSLPQEWLAPLR
jgi:glutathione S-transferase